MSGLYHDTCHHRIYRLTCDEFDELREFAEGKCQICGLPEGEVRRGRLCIDHDPKYGMRAVRGLLCDKCNTMLDRVERGVINKYPFESVIAYLYEAWFMRVAFGGRPLVNDVTDRKVTTR